jgi:hypothetical protein
MITKIAGTVLFQLSAASFVYFVCGRYFLPLWDQPRLFPRAPRVVSSLLLISVAAIVVSFLLIRSLPWIVGNLVMAGVFAWAMARWLIGSPGELLAEDIIAANHMTYTKLRDERPGQDEHFYLANTLLRRFMVRLELTGGSLPGMEHGSMAQEDRRRAEENQLNLIAWSETMRFSVLDPPNSIRALALYVVYKELPSQAHRYEEEFGRLTGPVYAMDDEAFLELYGRKNPRTAERMGEDDEP